MTTLAHAQPAALSTLWSISYWCACADAALHPWRRRRRALSWSPAPESGARARGPRAPVQVDAGAHVGGHPSPSRLRHLGGLLRPRQAAVGTAAPVAVLPCYRSAVCLRCAREPARATASGGGRPREGCTDSPLAVPVPSRPQPASSAAGVLAALAAGRLRLATLPKLIVTLSNTYGGWSLDRWPAADSQQGTDPPAHWSGGDPWAALRRALIPAHSAYRSDGPSLNACSPIPCKQV